MNYEEKTDLELSEMVAAMNYSSYEVIDGKVIVGFKHDAGDNVISISGVFSINNPANMWPIIVENGISLLQQDNEEGWCAFRWDNDNAECWHKNPLRAAAIVFLMMKDAEKTK